MSQLKYSVVLLVAALCLVTGQDLESLPACGRTCVTDMMETQAAALGCAPDASSCLCANPNFHNGINDCANQNCGADVAPTVTNYMVAFCATATVAPATPAPTSSPTAPETTEAPTPSPTSAPEEPASSSPSPAVESTTPASSVADNPVTSSTVTPESSSAPTPVQSPQSSTTLVTSASSTPTPSTTRKASSSSSPTSSSTSSTSATAAADAKSSSSSSSSGSKLSLGAIIGICVAGAIVLIVGIVLFMLRRHRARMHKRKSVAFLNQLKISEPMPGSGRTYADAYHSPRYPDEPASELEMRSRRYEDMVPRVAPKLIS